MMKIGNKKSWITGTVVFMRSDLKPPYCACCGDPNVPHRHIFNEHIKLDEQSDSIFPGLKVQDLQDFLHECLHRMKDIEGKRVKISLEVIETSGYWVRWVEATPTSTRSSKR